MDRITLKQSIENFKPKIESLKEVLNIDLVKSKIKSLEERSSDPSFWQDSTKAKEVFNELNSLKSKLELVNSIDESLSNLEVLYELSELESSELNSESLISADKEAQKLNDLYKELEIKLLLNSKEDSMNAIVEIHSGAGGTESLDWVSMLFRMYSMYAINHKYKLSILEYLEGDEAGIKSVTFKLEGENAYGYLKSESGVHRLIRLSPFDSDHARHTTFASVSVTPLISNDIDIVIDEKDIRVDVFHSSGAGGQGVNTTDSAVRITYLPLKLIVTCQNERSQIQNKEEALRVLKSKLYKIELEKRKNEMDKLNLKQDISFGSQIRTYTFHPYSLVKDHRTQIETSQVQKVMDGDLDLFINEYLRFRGKSNA